MIGDTNLFLYHSEDCTRLAEVEIMIAENSARRKRRGWEAVLLMLRYGKCFSSYVLYNASSPFCTFCSHTHEKRGMTQNQNRHVITT